jgi:hypothetical protein
MDPGAEPPQDPRLWFGRTDSWLGFGPLTWQGRSATVLYVFLVVVAVFTYSQLALTAVVVVFYTVAYVLLVVVRSNLLQDHRPPGP